MKKLPIIPLLFTTVLSGCAVTGKQDFDCPGMPAGIGCTNSMNIYSITDDKSGARQRIVNRVQEKRKKPITNLDSPVTWQSGADGEKTGASTSITGIQTAGADQPVPVMENARVMRVLVSPWIDSRKDLHMGEMVYTEVTPRLWNFGVEEIRAKTYAPVSMSTRAVGEAAKPAATPQNPADPNAVKMFDAAQKQSGSASHDKR